VEALALTSIQFPDTLIYLEKGRPALFTGYDEDLLERAVHELEAAGHCASQ
jgi:hypothetical protein